MSPYLLSHDLLLVLLSTELQEASITEVYMLRLISFSNFRQIGAFVMVQIGCGKCSIVSACLFLSLLTPTTHRVERLQPLYDIHRMSDSLQIKFTGHLLSLVFSLSHYRIYKEIFIMNFVLGVTTTKATRRWHGVALPSHIEYATSL